MTIKTDIETSVLIGDTDTTVLNPTLGRASIQKAELHNNTASTTTIVELFKSADAVSAASERIGYFTIEGQKSQWISEGVTVIPEGEYLLAKADSGNGNNVRIDIIYKLLTGTD